ncbi:MAG: hypothetical protein GXY83_29350 [Rhodopirellula sp.]|nr:hypothetical protein [Rhodopirellula sp.]
MTGAVLRLLALAALESRFGAGMEPPDRSVLTALVQMLASQRGLSSTLRASVATLGTTE